MLTFLDSMLIRANCYVNSVLAVTVQDLQEKVDGYVPSSEMQDMNDKVDVLFGSGLNVGTRIGLYVAFLAVMVFGFSMLFANSQKRQEKKEEVFPKALAIVCIVAPIPIVGIIELLANTVFAK